MIIAVVLVIIGVAFFLKNTGLIEVSWSVVWPLILIGVGVYAAIVSRRVVSWWDKIWDKISKKLG
ncbi:MAG: DUF5668 domain-containing protein [Patescibacteria group bacterium]